MTTPMSVVITDEEKTKVAYALNLCAASITQIIDSKDLIVLKQERELILGNLNLQNFVKHPALLDVIKQILNAITYFEIQAGDSSFIEKKYQQKLSNAIWAAVPSIPTIIAGGSPVSLAIAVAAQIGTGYMSYRRNKSQYLLDKEEAKWELRKHEIEQLNGLRTLLFETAWRLSSDYNFNDALRLTERQINRYSAAILEPDPLKRYERLDVMSDKFAAFAPFWYYKGNAAMEVFRAEKYSIFSAEYKEKAIDAYNEFRKVNFEFLREDIIAASCCLEYISLLRPDDPLVDHLLGNAMRCAGDNYDVLQQSIFVNLQLGKPVEKPLREMIVNGYNVAYNGLLLSKIYYSLSNKLEYEKLLAIVGEKNVMPWSENAEELLIKSRKSELSDEYQSMIKRIAKNLIQSKNPSESMYSNFKYVSGAVLKYCGNNNELANSFEIAEDKLRQAIANANSEAIEEFSKSSQQVIDKLLNADFSSQIAGEASNIIEKMKLVSHAQLILSD